MTVDIGTALEGLAAAVTALGGLYTGVHKLNSSLKHKKERYRQAILDQAKEEMAKIRSELDEKLKDLESELANQKENVARDMDHMKETYNSEIRVLGGKIEELREQLNTQHSQLIGFLTKLIDSK